MDGGDNTIKLRLGRYEGRGRRGGEGGEGRGERGEGRRCKGWGVKGAEKGLKAKAEERNWNIYRSVHFEGFKQLNTSSSSYRNAEQSRYHHLTFFTLSLLSSPRFIPPFYFCSSHLRFITNFVFFLKFIYLFFWYIFCSSEVNNSCYARLHAFISCVSLSLDERRGEGERGKGGEEGEGGEGRREKGRGFTVLLFFFFFVLWYFFD